MIREVQYLARMAAGCYKLCRSRPLANPHQVVAEQLAHREQRFLEKVRSVIFANPENPYALLFRHAGCEYGDLEHMVHADGLDTALEKLRAAGVWLSHDEFKGKQPIRRGGQVLAEASAADFVNPLVAGSMENASSGSRSRGTVTRTSLEYQLYREAQDTVALPEFLSPDTAAVAGYAMLPSSFWMGRLLVARRMGRPVERWFTAGSGSHEPGPYELATKALVVETHLLGSGVPWPESLPPNDYTPIARWIAERRSAGRDVLMMSTVSPAIRVAALAAEQALDIAGTRFLCGAEPLTEAKRETVEAAGCQIFSRYGISELGSVGWPCREMHNGSQAHVMRDSVAVIAHRRAAPMSEVEVDSLLMTPLLRSSAYVLINLEVDDCGTLGTTRCDCALSRLGLTQTVSDVYSFGKLTGHGITLLAGDVIGILERALPMRFGGAPGDYQLVERDEEGQTVTELRVNPRLETGPADEVRSYFLEQLRATWGGSLAHRQWTQAEALRVVHAEPIVSGGRKINPLVLLTGRTNDGRRD